jgi:hypothetical protein
MFSNIHQLNKESEKLRNLAKSLTCYEDVGLGLSLGIQYQYKNQDPSLAKAVKKQEDL